MIGVGDHLSFFTFSAKTGGILKVLDQPSKNSSDINAKKTLHMSMQCKVIVYISKCAKLDCGF